MDKNKNIRIKDIAEMAGVSAGTVDRVIHKRGKVSAGLEAKIQKIIKETGYTPNPIAQSLGATKDFRIAAMVPQPRQDKYWELVGAGIDHAKKEWSSYNMHINLFPFDLYDVKSFSEVADTVLETGPDAVFTVPMFYEQSLDFFGSLQQAAIPYVLFNTPIDAKIKQLDPLCFIGPDLYQSGRVAGELMHIACPNLQHITVMHVHENISSSVHLKEKEHGLRDFFKEQGADISISTHSFVNNEESFKAQIKREITREAYEGIFVSTSSATSITAKVLQELHEEDILLIGFDLLDLNVQFLKRGVINFLINQNPRYQAFQGLRYVVNHLLLHNQIPLIDLLPIEIITKENCDSFLNEKDNERDKDFI